MKFDIVSHNAKINRQHRIFPFGRKAICPDCSGLLSMTEEYGQYKCCDCKSVFKVISEGITDKDVICEQIL